MTAPVARPQTEQGKSDPVLTALRVVGVILGLALACYGVAEITGAVKPNAAVSLAIVPLMLVIAFVRMQRR